MPDNLVDIVPPADLNHLLAFLLAHAVKPAGQK
jgi:hypothetical protein